MTENVLPFKLGLLLCLDPQLLFELLGVVVSAARWPSKAPQEYR